MKDERATFPSWLKIMAGFLTAIWLLPMTLVLGGLVSDIGASPTLHLVLFSALFVLSGLLTYVAFAVYTTDGLTVQVRWPLGNGSSYPLADLTGWSEVTSCTAGSWLVLYFRDGKRLTLPLIGRPLRTLAQQLVQDRGPALIGAAKERLRAHPIHFRSLTAALVISRECLLRRSGRKEQRFDWIDLRKARLSHCGGAMYLTLLFGKGKVNLSSDQFRTMTASFYAVLDLARRYAAAFDERG